MSIQGELSSVFMTLFRNKSMTGGGNQPTIGMFFYLLLVFLILLLIKSFIVKIAYNNVMPTLMYSVNREGVSYEEILNSFNQISFVEALLLVILCNMLFTRA